MQIPHLDAGLGHVLGQILRHALGQRGDQDAAALGDHDPAFRQKVVDLALDRTDLGHRIDQSGRPDHLFREHPLDPVELPGPGRGADMDGLRAELLPFVETQRTVVQAGRQAEPELGQDRFAREVAPLHAADLRHRDVALVDDQQRVLREIFEQSRRRLARLAAGQIARVVLDPLAGAGGLDHFQIEGAALLQAFRLQQLTVGGELRQPLAQLLLDRDRRLIERRSRRHVMAVGIDMDLVEIGGLLAGQRVELDDALDLVAEKRDPPGAVLVLHREHVDRLAAHPERAALEGGVIAAILLLDQRLDQRVAGDLAAALHLHHHARIGLDRSDAVDARDRGHDHHVVAFQQRLGGGMAHAVDLLVDRAVLLDIGVGPRHVGFRLIVVVVADEILDRVVRKELLHLAVELGGQRLVRRQDQGRLLHRLDHLGHGEGLARPGDAEQDLVAFAVLDAAHQLGDRRRLVPGRLVRRDHLQGAGLGLGRLPLRLERRHRHGSPHRLGRRGSAGL